MDKASREKTAASIQSFRLPRYEEIPNVGLYLEQVVKYLNEALAPLRDISITGSMISNYVKKRLVANPVKKQYSREQIAYLLFIAVIKTVLSLDNIRILLEMQRETCESRVAYNYFCDELESAVGYVFGLKKTVDRVDGEEPAGKVMLHNAIITVAHKIYLDQCFYTLQAREESRDITAGKP